MTYFIFLVLLIPPVFYAWAQACPHNARTLVAELKRRWRLSVIQRHGTLRARRLFSELHRLALGYGVDEEVIQAFISMRYHETVVRLGTEAANEILGEPTPLERFY